MWLDATTKSLQVLLSGAVATTELPFTVSYGEVAADNTTSAPKGGDGQTNGATAVNLIAAPGAGLVRELLHASVWNADTIDATVTVRLLNGATARIILRVTLLPGETLTYEASAGWRVLTADGALVVTTGGGGAVPGTNREVIFNDAGALAGNAGLIYDVATKSLTVNDGTRQVVLNDAGGTGSPSLSLSAPGLGASFCTTTRGATLTDGTRSVILCDVSNSIGLSVGDGTRSVSLCDTATASAGAFSDGARTARLCTAGTTAGFFSDGGRTVSLCNGVDAISYVAVTAGNWAGSSPPSDVWLALDRIAAALNALASPP